MAPSRELAAQDIRALLFDVDGTLYVQKPVQRAMLRELLVAAARAPFRAPALLRLIGAYRHALEELRQQAGDATTASDLRSRQIDMAARRVGMPSARAASILSEWMEQRPLRHLGRYRRAGLDRLLELAAARGWPVGVFSDYPTRAKVEALGIAPRVSLHLCGLDAEVGALKPHPRGFKVACEQLGLPASSVLYIGDRPELDAAGAAAAGLPCFLVDRSDREQPLLRLEARLRGDGR